MGVGLALGHLAPRARLEELVAVLLDAWRRRAPWRPRAACRAARCGGRGCRGRGRPGRGTGGRGRGARAATPSRPATLSRLLKNSLSGSAPATSPEMCGVMVGSTWSPVSTMPSAASNRHRWSLVWPGVCSATHSRLPSVTTSASSIRRVGAGVRTKRRSATRKNFICMRRLSGGRNTSSVRHGIGAAERRRRRRAVARLVGVEGLLLAAGRTRCGSCGG